MGLFHSIAKCIHSQLCINILHYNIQDLYNWNKKTEWSRSKINHCCENSYTQQNFFTHDAGHCICNMLSTPFFWETDEEKLKNNVVSCGLWLWKVKWIENVNQHNHIQSSLSLWFLQVDIFMTLWSLLIRDKRRE